jgi:hypothetical protein
MDFANAEEEIMLSPAPAGLRKDVVIHNQVKRDVKILNNNNENINEINNNQGKINNNQYNKNEFSNQKDIDDVFESIHNSIIRKNQESLIEQQLKYSSIVKKEMHKIYIEDRVELSTNHFLEQYFNKYPGPKEKHKWHSYSELKNEMMKIIYALKDVKYPEPEIVEVKPDSKQYNECHKESGLTTFKDDLSNLSARIALEQPCFGCSFSKEWRACKKEAKRLLKIFEEMCYKQAILEYSKYIPISDGYTRGHLNDHMKRPEEKRYGLRLLAYRTEIKGCRCIESPETCLFVSMSQLHRLETRARSVALMNYFRWMHETVNAYVKVSCEFKNKLGDQLNLSN